jgi:hypothetical protein
MPLTFPSIIVTRLRHIARNSGAEKLFGKPLSSLADRNEISINSQHEKETTRHRIFFEASSVEYS